MVPVQVRSCIAETHETRRWPCEHLDTCTHTHTSGLLKAVLGECGPVRMGASLGSRRVPHVYTHIQTQYSYLGARISNGIVLRRGPLPSMCFRRSMEARLTCQRFMRANAQACILAGRDAQRQCEHLRSTTHAQSGPIRTCLLKHAPSSLLACGYSAVHFYRHTHTHIHTHTQTNKQTNKHDYTHAGTHKGYAALTCMGDFSGVCVCVACMCVSLNDSFRALRKPATEAI